MKWLSLWRQKRRLTQVQLGEKTGIDPNMISRYERETAIPTLENIKKIALGLGITIAKMSLWVFANSRSPQLSLWGSLFSMMFRRPLGYFALIFQSSSLVRWLRGSLVLLV